MAAAVPEVQISTVGKLDFLAIPNAKKLAERSSSMGIVSIWLFWAKAIVNGADREPGQITAVVNPRRCKVSANIEAQRVFVLRKSIILLFVFNWFLGSAWELVSRGSASLDYWENGRQSLRICVTRQSLVTSQFLSPRRRTLFV